MKKLLFALVAVFTLSTAIGSFSSCETKKEQEMVVNSAEDSLQDIISQKESELNDMVGTLNEIQEGFRKINEAQGRINVESRSGEKNQKQAILEDMKTITETMRLNKELIENLRQQLKQTSSSSAELKATMEATIASMCAQMDELNKQVADLRQQLAAKDITIAEQETQIGQLKTNVNDLSAENDNRARTINAQDKDLHTAYYVFGTKKELKNENILKSGEVLQQGNFNKDYFTKIDTRVDKVIKLYSKSAELKTNHPAGTYKLEKDTKGQYVLRITDPDRFWSVSKYLVILVK